MDGLSSSVVIFVAFLNIMNIMGDALLFTTYGVFFADSFPFFLSSGFPVHRVHNVHKSKSSSRSDWTASGDGS